MNLIPLNMKNTTIDKPELVALNKTLDDQQQALKHLESTKQKYSQEATDITSQISITRQKISALKDKYRLTSEADRGNY